MLSGNPLSTDNTISPIYLNRERGKERERKRERDKRRTRNFRDKKTLDTYYWKMYACK